MDSIIAERCDAVIDGEAVVTKDVESNMVMAGNLVKAIKWLAFTRL